MIRWFLIACGCLSITACTSASDDPTAALAVPPTIVAPADPPDILAFTDFVEPLYVSSWDVADIRAHIESIRSRPHTVRSSGAITEVIEIVDGDARITTAGTNAADEARLGDFTVRVSGSAEWVSYGHVRAGAMAMQRFAVSTAGLDSDELLSDPDLANEPIVRRFAVERDLFTETAALETMWVPYERNPDSIFLASILDRATVDGVLDDALAAIIEPETELTSDALVVPLDSSSEFEVLTIPLDRSPAQLSTNTGWTLTIEPGVAGIDDIGAPPVNDIVTRNALLASTAVNNACIAATVEATAFVEDGIVRCVDPQPGPRVDAVGQAE